MSESQVETILAETIRRLHFDHGITFAQMDETDVLPFSLSRLDSNSFLFRNRQR
jgi:hypothetical protein